MVQQLIQCDAIQQVDFCSGGQTLVIFQLRKVCSILFRSTNTTFWPGRLQGFYTSKLAGQEWTTICPNPFVSSALLETSSNTSSCVVLETPIEHGWPVLKDIRSIAERYTKSGFVGDQTSHSSIILSRGLFYNATTQVIYDGIASSFSKRDTDITYMVVSYVRREAL